MTLLEETSRIKRVTSPATAPGGAAAVATSALTLQSTGDPEPGQRGRRTAGEHVRAQRIGCSSKEPEQLKVNAYQGQHGRSLPVAIGVAIANPGLKVIDFGGDGDTYAIGMEHFMHSRSTNVNVTLIIMNNQVYGLTKGQAAPTAHSGLHTPSTPGGKAGRSVNPLKRRLPPVAFVGRGVSWQRNELSALIAEAINTKGFSLVDVFSPCVTYHREPGFRGAAPISDWYKQNYITDIKDAWSDLRDQIFTDERGLAADERRPSSPEAAIAACT